MIFKIKTKNKIKEIEGINNLKNYFLEILIETPLNEEIKIVIKKEKET